MNTISTAYLRADLVDVVHGKEIKRLLKEYVDIRIEGATNMYNRKEMEKLIARSVEIHKLLWIHVSAVTKRDKNINTGLLVQSINDVMLMHEKRLTAALCNRIPNSIWWTLFVISFFTMIAIGDQTGSSKSRRLVAVISLIMAFSALTTAIVDLDRSQKGFFKVGQHAMINLQTEMNHKAQ